SGKTHILHSLGELSTSEDPDLTCEFISLASLLDVIQTGPTTTDHWPDSLRLLIVDDFEIASASPDLQLQLCQLLQALAEKDVQIVIASREPPIRMNYIQEYLLRFLEGGLLTKLEVHPELLEEQKEAAQAMASVAEKAVTAPGQEEKQAVGEEGEAEEAETAEGPPHVEVRRDFLDEFLAPDPALTTANFRGSRVFESFEEAFRYPNKKWRNNFPLLVIESDDERRNHFFHALANRLQEIFTDPVSLLSIEKLSEMIALTPNFDWNGLLNKLAKSHVVLIDDCESVQKLPSSASGYLSAIVEETSGRDTLLMIGTSKRYKKEPVFGGVYKKATRKRM
ncbi:MAG: hypothetical protein JSV16_03275, partial [Candidatus Hydrogenedentota bacterium]